MKAVEIQDLSYTYPDGTRAINKLNLEIATGKRIALLGANGSGKTTLIYHLNGLILPQEGRVKVLGYEMCKNVLTMVRERVGILFDNPDNQLFSTTVFNDIAFGPRNQGLNEENVRIKVEQAMETVMVTALKDKPPFNLSLGQKKRVAIAGMLSMDPTLLVFDEPFSSMDAVSIRQVMDILDKLSQDGRTLIISTHDVDMVYAWAEDVVILDQGELLACGDISLLRNEALMQKAQLYKPLLADIFEGTHETPRTAARAKEIIRYYLQKQG